MLRLDIRGVAHRDLMNDVKRISTGRRLLQKRLHRAAWSRFRNQVAIWRNASLLLLHIIIVRIYSSLLPFSLFKAESCVDSCD